MIQFCAVFLGLFALSGAHSWMSCPPSFNTSPNRGGTLGHPCETWNGGSSTRVRAGDRLKVGWTSNNHAGGWVRLALVPIGQHKVYHHFEQHVLKVVCYGSDKFNRRSQYGDCIHPCNGRKGCKYQSDIYDGNRYDTTIKIPYNLPDGSYILQWMGAMSFHTHFYYSCATLKISGGNPALSCEQTGPIPVAFGCLKGMGTKLEKFTEDAKMGNFCFAEDGPGDQDADIRKVPVNVNCDPRITCEVSVNKPLCETKNNMSDITDVKRPTQICKGEILPPPEPTCEDGIKNNGEEMVDCGGPNCGECVEEPTEPIDGRIYTDMDYQEYVEWGSIEIRMSLRFKVAVRTWRFTLQFTEPVIFDQYRYWNCRLISVNEYNTIWTFGPESWNGNVKEGYTLSLGFSGRVVNPAGDAPQTVSKIFEDPTAPEE